MACTIKINPTRERRMTTTNTTDKLGIHWLIKLRWWAIAGQMVTIMTSVLFFNLSIPYTVVCGIILIETATNILLQWRLSTIKQQLLRLVIPLTLMVDILLLTTLLHFTGGPMNPFTFLFMVHISLGAILLPHRLSWAITISTILCYGLLFIPHIQFTPNAQPPVIRNLCDINQADMIRHLQGMWGAFAIASCLITFFVAKIQRSFAHYHETLSQLKHEQLNNERLSSLATLAAGAAHELATPLATIGIAAGEIVYECAHDDQVSKEFQEDATLIKDQVHRCKDILFQMSVDAGSMQGEPPQNTTTKELLKQTLQLLPDTANIVIDNKIPDITFNLPIRSISWVIKGLLKNGLDATTTNKKQTTVTLGCFTTKTHLCFAIKDHGTGMDAETIKRAIEPFFTTKEPGEGMGLGLFLANSICNRLNGSLTFNSVPHEATTVTITFGLDQVTP